MTFGVRSPKVKYKCSNVHRFIFIECQGEPAFRLMWLHRNWAFVKIFWLCSERVKSIILGTVGTIHAKKEITSFLSCAATARLIYPPINARLPTDTYQISFWLVGCPGFWIFFSSDCLTQSPTPPFESTENRGGKWLIPRATCCSCATSSSRVVERWRWR